MPMFTTAVRLAVPVERLFALHADVRNLPRLMPPPAPRVLRAASPTREGDTQVLAFGPDWLRLRWVAQVVRMEPQRMMVDVQRRGPFRRFWHAHLTVPAGPDGSVLVDVIDFRFFPSPAGALLDRVLVTPVLRLVFAARHRRTAALLASAG